MQEAEKKETSKEKENRKKKIKPNNEGNKENQK